MVDACHGKGPSPDALDGYVACSLNRTTEEVSLSQVVRISFSTSESRIAHDSSRFADEQSFDPDRTQSGGYEIAVSLRAGGDAVGLRFGARVQGIVEPGVDVDVGRQDVVHVRRALVAEHLELPYARS